MMSEVEPSTEVNGFKYQRYHFRAAEGALEKNSIIIRKEILHSIAEASDEYETDLKLQCIVLWLDNATNYKN